MKKNARKQKRAALKKRPPVPVFLLALAIAVAAWLLYARTLGADFVWDARSKVLINPFIHDVSNLPSVLTGRVLRLDVLDNNRPGNLLSLMLDAMLWGMNPAGYHATSVLLHGIVCAMLFLLILRLIERDPETEGAVPWPAFLAALAFAVHPLNCEPVSEVSYREDLLVAFGILTALLGATEFLRKPGLGRNLGIAALCCIALLFAVSSKENGVAGPVALAGYWLLWRRGDKPAPWIGLVAAASLAVGVFTVARFTVLPAHSIIMTGKPERLGGPSIIDTLHLQVRIWAVYLRHIVWAAGLCADYSYYSLLNYPEGISAAAVALVVAGLGFLATRGRMFAFGALIFLAALLPVSNLVPLYRPMADRFLYVPLLGGAFLLAEGLRRARGTRAWQPACIALAVAIPACAAATFVREHVWHDSLTLWQQTLAEDPASSTAADNLGWALLDVDRPRQAEPAFRRGILLTFNHDASPFGGLALALDAQGRTAEANDAFFRAAALDWRYWRPQELVRALEDEPPVADKLQVLATRNGKQK